MKVEWVGRSSIDAIVIDSCFPNLVMAIKHLVKSKVRQIPEFLITGILAIINSEIAKKSFIDINDINPIDFVSDIRTPAAFYVGNEDELVSTELFMQTFDKYDTKIKRIKLFKGNHSAERPDEIL